LMSDMVYPLEKQLRNSQIDQRRFT